MDYVWILWIYDRPGIKPEVWSVHKTEAGAITAMELTGKDGFTAKISLRD